MAERPFDVVLFGATGFVGALTAEHLAAAGGPGRRRPLARPGTAPAPTHHAHAPARREVGGESFEMNNLDTSTFNLKEQKSKLIVQSRQSNALIAMGIGVEL